MLTLGVLCSRRLKALCRAKGLKVSGRKAELIERLAEAPPGLEVNAEAEKPMAPPMDEATPSPSSTAGAGVAPPTASSVAPMFSTSVPAATVNSNLGASPRAVQTQDVEVLGRQEAEEADDIAYRAQRRAARRAKLSQYFEEEYAAVVGALEIRAGDIYQRAMGAAASVGEPLAGGDPTPPSRPPQSAPQPTANPAADASRYIDAMRASGRRLAWCRSFDGATGVGILVDLEERAEWKVDRRALRLTDDASLPTRRRVLHPGEFVEYEPRAAAEFSEGGMPNGGWVSGILGWPLMCETSADASAAAPATVLGA